VLFRCAALAGVGALAFAGAAVGADHGAGARFHTTTNLQTSLAADPACPGLALAASGTATGTEIGEGRWESRECLDFFREPGVILVHGAAAVTAADGSVLRLVYDVSAPADPSGAIHAAGTYTVTGGTRRFDGATGSGATVAIASAVTFTAHDELDGTIVPGGS
jgi:hypothetical protein